MEDCTTEEGSPTDTLMSLFDEMMASGDRDQRAKLVREAMLYLSARIDRDAELRTQMNDRMDGLVEWVQKVNERLDLVIEALRAGSTVTQRHVEALRALTD